MKSAARKAIRDSLASGYQHHSYEMERQIQDYVLYGKGNSGLANVLTLTTYADLLAPDRLRAMKNGAVCAATVLSRTAIEHGVESEISFALSDYYLNEIEKAWSLAQLEETAHEMEEMYREVVQERITRGHSRTIARALQYIHRNLYEPCRVADAAAYAGLNPQYFAVLFKQEVGMEPSVYIRTEKMKEAVHLLTNMRRSVAETTAELGYCSPSHFISIFKKHYGVTPKQMLSGRTVPGAGPQTME